MLIQQLIISMCSHRLFPACWQVVDGLLTTCYKAVDSTHLFQVFKQLVIVPQFINLLSCEWQPCSNLINEMTTLLQLVDKSVTNTCRSIVYTQRSRLEISPWYLYSFLLVQWSRDKAFDSLDGEYFSHNILDRQYTIAGLQKVSLPPLLTLNLKSSLHRFLYVVYYYTIDFTTIVQQMVVNLQLSEWESNVHSLHVDVNKWNWQI